MTTTPVAEWRETIDWSNCALLTAHIDQTCFEFSDVSYVEFAFSVEYCTGL